MAPRRSIGVDNEITVGRRDFSPAHFLFKIESFSLLSENGIDKYESSEFESGDYKWKLIIYPNGRNTEDGGNHVSAYLAVADINSLPTGWEFNAFFSFFLFNRRISRSIGGAKPGSAKKNKSTTCTKTSALGGKCWKNWK